MSSTNLATAGKRMLSRQLSAVDNDQQQQQERNDNSTPDNHLSFGLMVREASSKDINGDHDSDDEPTNNNSNKTNNSSSSQQLLPRGFSKHALRQSMTSEAGGDEEMDEAMEKEMENKFKRMTIKIVSAMQPLPTYVDDRLLVQSKDKIKSGMPYIELVWLRGARPENPTEVSFFNSSFQTVSRFVMVTPAKHLRKASFAVFAGLEDHPAAVIQKNRLRPIFFLARDGEIIYSFKRTTSNLIRVYEGKRTVEAACRFGILFTDKEITIRTLVLGALRDPVVRWTAAESFVANTVQIGSGCDTLLITVCFGLVDFFASPTSINAPDIAKKAVLHANPPKYIRDLMI
jgi:hypothetical protein